MRALRMQKCLQRLFEGKGKSRREEGEVLLPRELLMDVRERSWSGGKVGNHAGLVVARGEGNERIEWPIESFRMDRWKHCVNSTVGWTVGSWIDPRYKGNR